jgi:iron complex transport system ATP-binding protein
VVRASGRALLDGVDVAIAAGEVVGVVGPNGAGKSTLLRALAGEIRPHEGTVAIGGVAIDALSPRALARRRAVVAQHDEARVACTALDLVLLGRFPHPGLGDAPDDRAAAWRALALAGAAPFAERVVATLSGGERQRVRLARALAQIGVDDPGEVEERWLLLDEPLAGLDLAQESAMARRIRAVAARGIGVALVVHDLNLAAAVCDRVVVLREGRVVAAGAPGEALSIDVVARAFGVRAVRLPVPWAGGDGWIAVEPPRGEEMDR